MARSEKLVDLVPASWREALSSALRSDSFLRLEAALEREERADAVVLPPRRRIFAALELTSPREVKVVIMGQDPYPTAGNANGLAFSVGKDMKLPASLRNLFAGLSADLGQAAPPHGDLTRWARSGALLLNAVLTVRQGEPSSHKGLGWESFTAAVLAAVAAGPGPVVFFCLGAHAKALIARLAVDTGKHAVLVAPHPSPLNGRKFVDEAARAKPFTKINELLIKGGRAPVDWLL